MTCLLCKREKPIFYSTMRPGAFLTKRPGSRAAHGQVVRLAQFLTEQAAV